MKGFDEFERKTKMYNYAQCNVFAAELTMLIERLEAIGCRKLQRV